MTVDNQEQTRASMSFTSYNDILEFKGCFWLNCYITEFLEMFALETVGHVVNQVHKFKKRRRNVKLNVLCFLALNFAAEILVIHRKVNMKLPCAPCSRKLNWQKYFSSSIFWCFVRGFLVWVFPWHMVLVLATITTYIVQATPWDWTAGKALETTYVHDTDQANLWQFYHHKFIVNLLLDCSYRETPS